MPNLFHTVPSWHITIKDVELNRLGDLVACVRDSYIVTDDCLASIIGQLKLLATNTDTNERVFVDPAANFGGKLILVRPYESIAIGIIDANKALDPADILAAIPLSAEEIMSEAFDITSSKYNLPSSRPSVLGWDEN